MATGERGPAAVRLAVFDLDGTLTRTMEVDGRCYARACREVLGLARVDDDWSRYRHTTDEGIALELGEGMPGRTLRDGDLSRLRERFVDLLAAELTRQPGLFEAVPGAAAMLAALPRRGWAVAVATGAWRASARLKLAAAGLPAALPLATSDGRPERGAIVRHAIDLAGARHGTAIGRVVAVGDAIWDLRTARELELPFVGIDAEGDGAVLRRAGARCVLGDYLDPHRVVEALEGATA